MEEYKTLPNIFPFRGNSYFYNVTPPSVSYDDIYLCLRCRDTGSRHTDLEVDRVLRHKQADGF